MTLSMFTDELAQTATKGKNLTQIDRIITWSEWIGIIQLHYYKGERGNKLYDLSDIATMTKVIDRRAFSDFCGVDSSNQVLDGGTIGRFLALLVKHNLQEKLLGQVVQLLSGRGLILKKGTIVDSTIIAALTSTKYWDRQRDSDAHQAKNGNTQIFGY